MNAFVVLWKKEWTEAARTSKLIWLPAVFVLLGITQPLLAKFMPDILKSAGNLPAGTVIEIPPAQPGEVLGQTLSQFGSLGVLAICLAFMGMLSGERRSGTAAWILVKPVSSIAYMAAKWAVSTMVTLGSFALGYAAAWYETAVLIGVPDTGHALAAGSAYAGWLALILIAVLAAGAWFNAPAAAAFIPFGAATLLQLAGSFLPERLSALPSGLAAEAVSSLQSQQWPAVSAAALTAIIAGGCLIALAAWGVRSRPLRA
ncbi:ABC transporter permease [Cohnella pontilimi]|uniref:ABC transporter permease n=1 Tax=Cohnella pontilimi TaxID=2564100 RepID=A0A4U0F6K7_9BACL|nr:ABC transporter permease [Cohnella pontilimi]TJY38522.1 ABC transporter permease [Cohnella pontilimi]